MASWIAWPWFCDTLEISTPNPSVTNRNSSAPSANVSGEPRNGTPKTAMPTAEHDREVDGRDHEVRHDLAEHHVPAASAA